MATQTHSPSWAYRLGRGARRAWYGYRRQEHRAMAAAAARGWPVGLAKAGLWAAKLAVLAVLLYAAFWIAFALVLVVVCLWAVAHADLRDWELERRNGHLGFGWYDRWGSMVHKDEDPFDF